MIKSQILSLAFIFIVNHITMHATAVASNLLGQRSVYGVVLAGGSGKRLWPLSRKKVPKQFVSFIKGKTLIESTIDRVSSLVSSGGLWAVTTADYEEAVRKYNSFNTVVTEPALRNTAPAILLTTLKIYDINPNAIVFFVPADHYIPEEELFVSTMNKAIEHAAHHDNIVLLGIEPSYAASEYGYIEYNPFRRSDIHSVERFHEKPSTAIAQSYIKAGNMLWNAGIFCAKASVFLQEFKKWAPEILDQVRAYIEGKGSYETIIEKPFDIAVLEKTKKCVVLPTNFQWSDVGTLEQFLSIKSLYEPQAHKTIQIGGSSNLVEGTNKKVVLLNLDNICLVEVNDVLFITRRNQTEKVKDVIEYLKHNNLESYL